MIDLFEQAVEYEACIGQLQGAVDKHVGCLFLYGGDLNVPKISNTTCNAHVRQFVESNNLLWLDVLDGECDYTYHSDVNSHYSLLDHFIVSPSMASASKTVKILSDGDNPSDHFAISCIITIPVGNSPCFHNVNVK